jgi:hypothetical protein
MAAPEPLKRRFKRLKIENFDWYLEAYNRAAARIAWEKPEPYSAHAVRLGRHLQALYDKLVAMHEDEQTRKDHARATAIGINHAVTDRGLPRSMCRHYEVDTPIRKA